MVELVKLGELVEIDCEKSMKLETSPKVTNNISPSEVCIGVAVSVKKYLRIFYYSISQKVITLSGRRFVTVSGVLLHYRAIITLSGVLYYIIRHVLQYRAFITLSVGTCPAGHQGEPFNVGLNNVNIWGIRQSICHQKFGCGLQE